MKKVFLSLAVIAALTVVSCKQADANAEATTDSTVVAVDSVADNAVEAVDSTADAAKDSITATADAAKEEVKK
jgi:uncharacterized protein YcfL